MAHYDVFVSYSRRNKDFTRRLCEAMEANGFDIWVDWDDIPPTADWRAEIKAGIESSDAFIFIISPDSVQSVECRKEIVQAVANNKRLVPLLYQELATPELNAQLEPAIKVPNWIFFREQDDFDDSIATLVEILRTDLDYVRLHTRLLVRATEWHERNRQRGYLLTGEELIAAEAWLRDGANKQPQPTQTHTDYIFTSRQVATQRQRRLLGASVIAALLMMVLAIVALQQAMEAANQRDFAQEQRDFALTQEAIAQNNAQAAERARQEAVAAQQEAERNARQSQSLLLVNSAEQAHFSYDIDLAMGLTLEAYRNAPDEPRVQRLVYLSAYQISYQYSKFGQRATTQVAVSPDGTMGAMVTQAGEIVLWDIVSGDDLHIWQNPNDRAFLSQPLPTTVDFTPDGERLIVGNSNGTVYLFHTQTFEILNAWQTTPDFIFYIYALPDGNHFLRQTGRFTVEMWSLETGEQVRNYNIPRTNFRLAVDAEGRYLATWALQPNSLVIQEIETGARIRPSTNLSGYETLYSVGFQPVDERFMFQVDQQFIIEETQDAPATNNGPILRHDGSSFAATISQLVSLPQRAMSLGLNRGFLITRIYPDLRYYSEDFLVRNSNTTIFPTQLQASDDGRVILAAMQDGDEVRVMIFDDAREIGRGALDWPARRLLPYRTADGDYRAIAPPLVWSPTTDDTNTPPTNGYILDLETMTVLDELPMRFTYGVMHPREAAFYFLSRAYNGISRLDLNTLTLEETAIDINQASVITISADGTRLAAGTINGEVILYDMATNAEITRFRPHPAQFGTVTNAIFAIAISPDNQHIATLSEAARAMVINDIETGDVLHEVPVDFEQITYIMYHPNGDTLLFSDGRDALLWDVSAQQVVQRLPQLTILNSPPRYSADGEVIVVSNPRFVALYDALTGSQRDLLWAYPGVIYDALLHDDGQTLTAVGAGDAHWMQWQRVPVSQAAAYIRQTRTIPEFTCLQRAQYNIQPLCDAEEIAQETAANPVTTTDDTANINQTN